MRGTHWCGPDLSGSGDRSQKGQGRTNALYEAFDNKEAAGRASAILALVGAVNIPIIYWSVEWWYSLHQPASISFTGESSIHPEMLRPLMLTISGFYCFFGWVLLLQVRNEILHRERNTRWVRDLIQR